jgi:hypothetical protein
MSIRASASACEISPAAPMPLAGFTGAKRMSTGISQPLYASAVHIRGGAGGCIMIALDLFSIDPHMAASIREKVFCATGTPRDKIFISTTGCHSAPYAEDAVYLRSDPSYAPADSAYRAYVIQKSVQAASESAVSTRPASMALVAFDRPGTGALLVKGNNGRVIATVIVYDDVPDYMGRDNTVISADMVGTLRENLGRRLGSDAVTLFMSAPCAEQIMQERADYGEAAAQAAGKTLSDELISRIMMLRASDFSSDFTVAGVAVDLHGLPRRELPHIFEAAAHVTDAKQAVATAGIGQHPDAVAAAQWNLLEASRTMGLVIAYKEGFFEKAMHADEPQVVQSLRIGPITLLGVPCCVSRSAAQNIVERSASGVWLAQCVNGTMMGSTLTWEDPLCGSGFTLRGPVFQGSVGEKLASAIMRALAGC